MHLVERKLYRIKKKVNASRRLSSSYVKDAGYCSFEGSWSIIQEGEIFMVLKGMGKYLPEMSFYQVLFETKVGYVAIHNEQPCCEVESV